MEAFFARLKLAGAAFKLAKSRKGKVTNLDKSNVLESFLDLTAQVVHVGNSSLKIKITVMMDTDYREDTQIQTAEATFIFVAVDENGKPHKIQRG